MKKILIIIGTRPEAIKMAPIIKQFQLSKMVDLKVCVTGQHREMLDQVLDFFNIIPDFDFNLMKPNQNLSDITSSILLNLQDLFNKCKFDFVFVHGDTTTSMASALTAFYNQVKVCHVEAGLRTFDIYSPFPEELNRQINSRIATYHFAPTENSKDNLLKEGIPNENILVCGNSVIDALLIASEKIKNYENDEINFLKDKISLEKKIILVTGHRRENYGEGVSNFCEALKTIAKENKTVEIVYPVHLNPNIKDVVKDKLSNISNVHLIAPLSYPAFVWLMNQSNIILTDSGGVQEEAPSLGKPVLVMRETTERPEAVEAGTVKLVGTNKELIVSEVRDLLNNDKKYHEMSKLKNPYGNGDTSKKIVDFILNK